MYMMCVSTGGDLDNTRGFLAGPIYPVRPIHLHPPCFSPINQRNPTATNGQKKGAGQGLPAREDQEEARELPRGHHHAAVPLHQVRGLGVGFCDGRWV